MTLVENLRRYVGEQVPPEVHSQTWESERQELLETVQVREYRVHLGGAGGGVGLLRDQILGEGWPGEKAVLMRGSGRMLLADLVPGGHCCPFVSHLQHLREDRDGLHTTAELLQVRVQSLVHILAIQEEELTRQVGPCPSGSLWVRAVGLLPDPAGIVLSGNSASCCGSYCLGRTERKSQKTPASSAPPGAHTSTCPPPRRFSLQIPWSPSSAGSASPC